MFVAERMNFVQMAVVGSNQAMQVPASLNIINLRCACEYKPRIDSAILKCLIGGLNEKVNQRSDPGNASFCSFSRRRIDDKNANLRAVLGGQVIGLRHWSRGSAGRR